MQSKNNSQVAQSLVKIALEKGLIQPEKYKSVKEAATKLPTNLTPTDNLSTNIIKLCTGLRSQGFSKYADEVESKFVQYKKAQALYDVSGETGEDMVDRAHPDGSHQMEGMQGDSVIETILDRQKKIQQAVFKTPTGKLASKDALNVVRIILGQAQQTNIEEQKAAVQSTVNEAVSIIEKAIDDMIDIASSQSHFDPNMGNLFSHPWTTIQQHKSILLGYLGVPGIITAAILQFFNKYRNSLKDMKEQLQEDAKDYASEHSKEHLDAIISRVHDLKQLINEMPNDSPEMKTNIIQRIDGGLGKLEQASDLFTHLGVPFAQTAPQPLQQPAAQDPTEQKIHELMDKIDAAVRDKKLTVEQHDQIAESLVKASQALKDPQKAEKAKQAVDRMEQWLKSKNLA